MKAVIGRGGRSVHLSDIEHCLPSSVEEQRDAVHRKPPLTWRLVESVGQLESAVEGVRTNFPRQTLHLTKCLLYNLWLSLQTGDRTDLMDRPFKSSTSPNFMTSLWKTETQTERQNKEETHWRFLNFRYSVKSQIVCFSCFGGTSHTSNEEQLV